jgi:predicted methyltransferase
MVLTSACKRATSIDAAVIVAAEDRDADDRVDRAAHNADVFAALRPGGTYVIIDSSAAEDHGAADSEQLHRIEQSLVVRELEAAGFELTRSADFLRNPADTRDWNALPWRDPERAEREEFSDKFVLELSRGAA